MEDGGPGEGERVVAELREPAPPMRVCATSPSSRAGPGAARNAGWQAARGDVIAFTDDDTIPEARWLDAGAQALQGGADAVSGRTVVPVADAPTDAEANVQGLERATFADVQRVRQAHHWLEHVGGFDPRFRRAYREDSDLEFRLLDAGARIVRADDAVVIHPPRQERPFASLRQQRNQFYDALLFRKHPRPLQGHDPEAPAGCLLRHHARPDRGLLALLLGRPRLALLATVLWATLVGRFFVQRASRPVATRRATWPSWR